MDGIEVSISGNPGTLSTGISGVSDGVIVSGGRVSACVGDINSGAEV